MANLKPLRPSLKEKKRYVVYELFSETTLKSDEVIRAINDACLSFMGTLHFGKAGILILKNQMTEKNGIIRVNNKYVDYLKASLMQMTRVGDKKVSLEAKGVSGILKKAKEKFMTK